MALLEQPAVDGHIPISPEAAKAVLANRVWGDEAALELVVQDTQKAENFAASKSFVSGWAYATALYQSPFTSRYWEGTQIERASVPFYTLATAVNSLVPQVVNGLFYENPPFMVQNRPGTRAQAARAVGAVLAYQLEDINFREELRLGVMNAVLFGTALWKWGWESYTRKRKEYRRKSAPVVFNNPFAAAGAQNIQVHDTDDDIEEVEIEEQVDRPTFEHIVNLREVMVDPGLNVPDVRKAKYVVHRMYMTWEQLDALRDRPGYNIPSRKELLELFLPPKEPVEAAPMETSIRNPLWDMRAEPRYEASTVDPFNEPLEVLERWDGKRVIVVLQKKAVICNDENAYGEIPFLSVGWWDVPEAFYSMGLAKTIGSEQRLQQGITNVWLDNAALNLNGVYVRVRGKSVPTQSIRIAPGKIVEVDNKDDFKALDRTPPVPEAGQHLSLSAARVEQVSGASDPSSVGVAGSSGHSNLARSAAGANLLASGSGNRVSDFVEKVASQVIVPFLYQAHEMNREMLPVISLRYILSQELQHEYMQDKQGSMVELLNARVKFSISAGAKMQARRAMAQALPIMVNFLTNQQIDGQLGMQGKKIDVVEVLRMFFEVSEWKNFNDVVTEMTPEDQKRWQMMQPGAQVQAKTQAQSQLMNQQYDRREQLADQENMSRAARDVLRHAFETSVTPEVLNGTPGATAGFGSNE